MKNKGNRRTVRSQAVRIICALASLGAGCTAGTINYTFATIDAPGASQTYAYGINGFGEIVGEYLYPPPDSSGKEAADAFSLTGGMYSSFSYPGAYQTAAYGVNNLGQIVGLCQAETYGTLGTCQDFYGVAQGWEKTGTSFNTVAFPGAISNATDARAINDNGQIVGGAELSGGTLTGYELTAGSYVAINPPGSPGSYAYGINNAGAVVGFFCAALPCQQEGFLYSAGVYTTIAVPGAYATQAFGINDLGEVVGIFQSGAGAPDSGFIWENGVFQTVNDPLGTRGTEILGVNDAGEIVGTFIDSSGEANGFSASAAAPEPGTTGTAVAGCILMLVGIVKRRHFGCLTGIAGATLRSGAVDMGAAAHSSHAVAGRRDLRIGIVASTMCILLLVCLSSGRCMAQATEQFRDAETTAPTASPAAATPVLRVANGAPGIVYLNEQSGAITFCPAAVSSGLPISKCLKIGSIATTNLAGNGSVVIVATAAFVTNSGSKIVAECSLDWYAATGLPYGSCVTIANPLP
jgi:probable HAF family extracellular repeat protein